MDVLDRCLSKAKDRPVKVVQFGEGNFLRGFADYMIDVANAGGVFDGSVVIVKPIEYGDLSAFHEQECQYTVVLRGKDAYASNNEDAYASSNEDTYASSSEDVCASSSEYGSVKKDGGDGGIKEEIRIITCVSDVVDPYTEYGKYESTARCDTLRFVISNTTEAGIVYDGSDMFESRPPRTFPGKLTKFLYDRYRHFDGDARRGLVIIPCELIEHNGSELRKCVNEYISLWGLPQAFGEWVGSSCTFCSTLVDRIVTGYPGDEADALCERFGYGDRLIVTGELFALWVIESDDPSVADELPLHMAGLPVDMPAGSTAKLPAALPVIFTNDQAPYRERKVRILNGAHTAFVHAAFMAGNDYVGESMGDAVVRGFLMDTLYEEIIPTLQLPKDELLEFAKNVIGRFENPYVRHRLLDITLNSVSKWRTRCKPSLVGHVEKCGKLPLRLAFSIAALMAFYNGTELRNGTLIGKRDGVEYAIRDDIGILEFFANNSCKPTREYVMACLTNVNIFGEDMTRHGGLPDAVAGYLDDIRKSGMRVALENVQVRA